TADPAAWIDPFIDAGADSFIFCFDSALEPGDLLKTIKARGKYVGVSLLLNESLELLEPYWNDLDILTIVGTEMGIKGASMDASVPGKIRQARDIIRRRGLRTEIEADGGIRPQAVPLLDAAGAARRVRG